MYSALLGPQPRNRLVQIVVPRVVQGGTAVVELRAMDKLPKVRLRQGFCARVFSLLNSKPPKLFKNGKRIIHPNHAFRKKNFRGEKSYRASPVSGVALRFAVLRNGRAQCAGGWS
jgi:hypothetical protein